MRILDIDLDFFQNDIHNNEIDNENFLENSDIKVWDEKEFISFLENSCGLEKNKKILGRLVKHHVEAYFFWKELIETGKIKLPFEVTHIDAHSDLGFSINLEYSEFLKSLDKERKDEFNNGINFDKYTEYLNSGNYLLDAVISKWINKILYVYHPKLEYLDVTTNVVENIVPHKTFKFNFCSGIKSENIILDVADMNTYKNVQESYDFITVSLSPPYVQEEMRRFFKIIEEYIEII